MTTKATMTKFVQVQRGDGGSPETFTKIAEVNTFKGPASKAKELDATSFDSAGMEYIAGLTDGGDFSFDVNYVGTDPQQQGLRTDMTNGTKRNFKLVFNDMPVGGSNATSVAFAAVVTEAPSPSGNVNAIIKAGCTLKISGLPVWTYAA